MKIRRPKLVLFIAGSLALVAGLVALLPRLLSGDRMADLVVAQLERDFGRHASVGDVHASWTGGVIIRDLVIERRPGFGDGPLLHADAVRFPLDLGELIAGGPRHVTLTDATLYVVLTEDDYNLRGMPPFQMRRMIVEGATVHIVTLLPESTGQTTFRIAGATIAKDLDRGGLSWNVQPLPEPDGNAPLLATEGVWGEYHPDENEPAAPPHADLALYRLDLAPLSLAWFARRLARDHPEWPQLPSGPLTGVADLDLRARIDDLARIDTTGRIRLHDLAWPGEAPAPTVKLGSLTSDFATNFDPATHAAIVESLSIEAPGLALAASAQLDDRTTLDLHVATLDPNRLAQAFHVPALDPLKPWLGAGPLALTLDLASDSTALAADLTLDATRWQLHHDDLDKPADNPLSLQARLRFERPTGHFQLAPVTLQSDHASLQGHLLVRNWDALVDALDARVDTDAPLPALRRLLSDRPGLDLGGDLEIANLATIEPIIADLLPPDLRFELAGPASASFNVLTSDPNVFLTARLDCPPPSRLAIARPDAVLLDKPADTPLRLLLNAAFDTAAPALRQVRLDAAQARDTASLTIPRFTWSPDGPWPTRLDARFAVANLPAWLDLLPFARLPLDRNGVDVTGELAASLALADEPNQPRSAQLRLDLHQAGIQIASPDPDQPLPLFQKPANLPAVIGLDLRQPLPGPAHLRLMAEIYPLSIDLTGRATVPTSLAAPLFIRPHQLDWTVDVHQLAALAQQFPLLFDPDSAGPFRITNPAGRLTTRGHAEFLPGRVDLATALDASDAAFTLLDARTSGPADTLWQKDPNQPLALDARLEINYASGLFSLLNPVLPQAATDLVLHNLTLATDPLTATLAGRVALDPLPGQPALDPSRIARARLDLDATVRHDPDRLAAFPPLANLLRPFEPTGRTDLQADFQLHHARDAWTADLSLDLTEAGFSLAPPDDSTTAWPLIGRKPAGTPLTFTARLARDPRRLDVRELALTFADNRLAVAGTLSEPEILPWLAGDQATPAAQADFEWNLDAPDLAAFAPLVPATRDAQLAGAAHARVHALIQFRPTFTLYFEPSKLDARLQAHLGDRPVRLALEDVQFSSAALVMPRTELTIGENQLVLVADLRELPLTPQDWSAGLLQPHGQVHLLGSRLDLDDLAFWAKTLNGPPAEPDDQAPPPPLYLAAFENWNLQGKCDLAQLLLTDPDSGARLDLAPFRSQYSFAQNHLHLDCTAGLSGGSVVLNARTDLAEPNPTLYFDQIARDLRPSPAVSRLVESQFPGLKVTGLVSEQKSLTAPVPQILAGNVDWLGSGITELREGTLYGPGGPEWVLDLFPGLRLVEYPFEKMTNEFSLLPDGLKKNSMLFTGQDYDIYIDGESRDIEDRREYQKVMDLLVQEIEKVGRLLEQVDAGELDYSPDKLAILRQSLERLQQYYLRHQAGERLKVTQASYVIGALVSRDSRERFELPEAILRLPFFHARGFVVGLEMVALTTQSFLAHEIFPSN